MARKKTKQTTLDVEVKKTKVLEKPVAKSVVIKKDHINNEGRLSSLNAIKKFDVKNIKISKELVNFRNLLRGKNGSKKN